MPRLVAVLFADLVSSTETVAKLGPEAGEAWRKRFLAAMREALAAARGREVQHTGDGLFAAFESASDAVVCGIGIQRRVARASERSDAGAHASARVGLAAGEASEDAEGVHGLVVVEAARLCSAAKPGQILASALVEALATGGPHRFAPVGELTLKGLPAPVAAREVAWEHGRATIPLSLRLAELAEGPFVGRAAERAQLDAALEGARRGERRLVLLAGEPGIGKTRLASELARDAHAAGAVVLDGRCDEDLGAPFQPFAQALAHLAAHAPLDELRTLLSDDTLAAAALAPELRRRLPDLAALPLAESEAERWRLFEAIDTLLAAASRAAPLIVLLDDLHWADRPSLVLLRHLLRSARPAALLLLGTYRETDLSRTHPLAEVLADLRRESRVERVLLRGLAEQELGELVAARAEHDAPPAFVRALQDETEGNPFFAEEVLRHLAETGVLRREGGRWSSDRPLAELGIPEGVRDVIGRRLSRLAEGTNDVLRAAAVLGREFEAGVLDTLAGTNREALLDALDEAQRARLVREVPGASGRFSFTHALIRQTLYEELPAARRARLHWKAGEALQRRRAASPDEHVSEIAHHLAEGVLAGDALRAADASLRAGERAARLAAQEEARLAFERALALLDQAGVEEPERRYRAWLGRGEAEQALGEGTATRQAFARAAEIAAANGWTARQAQALFGLSAFLATEQGLSREITAPLRLALQTLGPVPDRARLLARLVLLEGTLASDFTPVDAMLAEARAIAEASGDADADFEVDQAELFLLEGSPLLERRAALAARRDFASLSDGTVAARVARGHCRVATARGDRAALAAWIEALREVCDRSGIRPFRAWVETLKGGLAIAEGRFTEGKRFAAAATEGFQNQGGPELGRNAQRSAVNFELGRAEQIGPGLETFLAAAPLWLQVYRAMRASALTELGRADDARRELDAFDALALPRRGWGWPLVLRHAAEATARLGDAERAARLATWLEPYAGQLLMSWGGSVIEGAADRARGQALATLGRLDEAIRCYESGLALEQGFEAPALAARTRYWLARALATRASTGDAARALAEAEAACDAARGFGMLRLAEQAETLAAQLG